MCEEGKLLITRREESRGNTVGVRNGALKFFNKEDVQKGRVSRLKETFNKVARIIAYFFRYAAGFVFHHK